MNSNETQLENTQETNESPQGERLFTASEVEAIVKKRVARIKTEKATQEGSGPSPAAEDLEKRLADITKREAEITKREAAINCKEYISSKGYAKEILDVLDTGNFEEFKKKADTIQRAYNGSDWAGNPHTGNSRTQPLADHDKASDGLRGAFEKTAHEPKNKPY